ncbi:conserved membrane hypothetical protein [Hyella patelloides LEGE 07179]|uniref:Glycosyltransferase RgtA/B/C/D-like domain-containing protein n=1 Tax=Hyella patelloides LEGE 07179 TaxID=945734 RepID=A0A563VJ67_9CYAN|nr:hypothetical protein [Hyella patelloides]VEP11431.1 conserved membrane hypothetical protein [Hyella patelloides LEGE 07179]
MTIKKNCDRSWQLCFIITLVAPIVYGLLDLQTAFQGDWIVQDDARQHVFWMMRYLDPELFPNDLIADYFQSVAPFGYTSLYKVAASFGIDPLVFNKLVPVGLRLVITYYFFLLCREIFPVPIGCAISTLLLNHNIWLKDDIVSGTPRAFLYPFLIAFLYYFTKQSLIPCLITIVLLSWFYPQTVFLASGMLVMRLIKWQGLIPTLSPNQEYRYFSLIGLTVAFLVMLPYAIKTSDYAPIITRAEAILMPEFHYGGRSNFFKGSIFEYLVGRGNGVMISTAVFSPIILISSLFLPLVIKKSHKFTLAKKINANLDNLVKLLIASLGMYILAHIVLFRLHLPSRYTTHSLRIVVTISAGITITVVLDYLFKSFKKKFNTRQSKVFSSLVIFAIALLTYSSFFDPFSPTGYKIGSYPELYHFFQQQPKDIMIASLVKEADNLPTFTKRSTLVSREYAIPYQLGYYKPFRRKIRDLITAQYSNNLQKVQQIIRKYNISYWLIEEESFTSEYVIKNRWFKQYKLEHEQAISNLENNQIPIVKAYQDTCQAFSTNKFTVIETQCLLKIQKPQS